MPSDWMRVRPPAGRLSAVQAALLAAALEESREAARLAGFGDLDLRVGPDALRRLRAAGLHARAVGAGAHRVLSSPLTGRVGGQVDVRALAHRLELTLREAEPETREIVVTIDDGSGDLAAASGLVLAAAGRTEFTVLIDGAHTGEVLLLEGPDADLADWVDVIVRRSTAEPGPGRQPASAGASAPPIGWLDHSEGGLVTLGAAVPDGVLDRRQWEFLAAIERPIVLTPWRTMLLCDLDEWAAEQVVRVLAPMGFVFDAASPVLADLAP